LRNPTDTTWIRKRKFLLAEVSLGSSRPDENMLTDAAVNDLRGAGFSSFIRQAATTSAFLVGR